MEDDPEGTQVGLDDLVCGSPSPDALTAFSSSAECVSTTDETIKFCFVLFKKIDDVHKVLFATTGVFVHAVSSTHRSRCPFSN